MDKCQRCQIKPIQFICDSCRPYTLFCSHCDTSVHSLPLKMNHHRKQITSACLSPSILPIQNPSPSQQDRAYSPMRNNSFNSNDNQLFFEELQCLKKENQKLKADLLDLSHLNSPQDNLKEEYEAFYETKLAQLGKENASLKRDNEKLIDESAELSVIVTKLQKQIEQMSTQIDQQGKEIQIRKEKHKDLEGFYIFKYEEMQKEKDFLVKQLQRHESRYPLNKENQINHNGSGYQVPIKDNPKVRPDRNSIQENYLN